MTSEDYSDRNKGQIMVNVNADADQSSLVGYTVFSCGERRTVTAERVVVSADGLQFFVGDEIIAWFATWSSYEKSTYNVVAAKAFNDMLKSRGFSLRARKLIQQLRCYTIKDLLELTPEQLISVRYFGAICAGEVIDKRKQFTQLPPTT